jgi:hypothetical protein
MVKHHEYHSADGLEVTRWVSGFGDSAQARTITKEPCLGLGGVRLAGSAGAYGWDCDANFNRYIRTFYFLYALTHLLIHKPKADTEDNVEADPRPRKRMA